MRKQFALPLLCLLSVIFLLPLSVQGKDFIRDIRVRETITDLAKGDSSEIEWTQDETATITLILTDIHGNIVRTLLNQKEQKAGHYKIVWDGDDDEGVPCPDGVYFTILKGRSKKKGTQTFNPTAQAWGEDVVADTIGWKKEKGIVAFSISRRALCRIRVYVKDGGPMYKAITGWKLYLPGEHQEDWDGMDLNGLIQVTDLKDYQVGLDGFTLPDGSIFLTGSETRQGADVVRKNKYPIHPPHGRNVAFLTVMPDSIAPDPLLSVQLAGDIIEKSIYTEVAGTVQVHVDLQSGLSPARQLREEFEMYLYVDGEMITELNRAEVPQTINWDTEKQDNGDHVVTINILTTADRAATFSQNVRIANNK